MSDIVRRATPAKAELLDNPNDRSNLQIATDAYVDGSCKNAINYETEECALYYDLDDDEPIRDWGGCHCLLQAKRIVEALEAAGRFR